MVNGAVLKGFKVFQGIKENDLAKIAGLCTERAMAPGDALFLEGVRATHLHLCRTGKVDLKIWVNDPFNIDMIVHTAEGGELFGWSAVVEPYTYTATAECAEAGHEICIQGAKLLDLFDQYPNIGLVIMRGICSDVSVRLKQTRQKLSVEWLNGGVSELAKGSGWGEPKRR